MELWSLIDIVISMNLSMNKQGNLCWGMSLLTIKEIHLRENFVCLQTRFQEGFGNWTWSLNILLHKSCKYSTTLIIQINRNIYNMQNKYPLTLSSRYYVFISIPTSRIISAEYRKHTRFELDWMLLLLLRLLCAQLLSSFSQCWLDSNYMCSNIDCVTVDAL